MRRIKERLWSGMRALLLSLAASLTCSWGAEQFYCAPTGTANAAGSRANPWDLATAIGPSTKLKPGDTLWLLPGLYQGNFQSYLYGSAEAPITVRSTPEGLARLDGQGETYPLTIRGAHTIYRDLEITQSSTWRTNAETPVAVQCLGPHIKLINLIIHDAGQGIGSWMDAHAMEAYGCVIYNNGIRPLEHGVYVQNDVKNGIKRFEDNIIFNNSGFGIHGYTKGGQLTGFEFIGNVLFNNGTKRGPGEELDNLFVGGAPPADQITIRSNYCVFTGDTRRFNLRLSYQNHQANPHGWVTVADNVIVGGTAFLAEDWRRIILTNNVLASSAMLAQIRPPPGGTPSDYIWNFNRYYGAAGFNAGQPQRFAEWQQTTALDRQSTHHLELPKTVQVVVRPNRYESNRAHIVVLNWAQANIASVSLAGVLKPGTPFEVLNGQDYFGPAILQGVYGQDPITLPLTNLVVALPKGPAPLPRPTGPFFNVFVVRQAKRTSSE